MKSLKRLVLASVGIAGLLLGAAGCTMETLSSKASDISLTAISLPSATVRIATGSSETLQLSFEPSDASDKSVTWSSSNPDAVSVVPGDSGSAVVTGNSSGKATILAKSSDGNRQAYCTVYSAPSVTVSYLDTDSTKLLSPQSYIEGDTIDAEPQPEKSGYVFSGWYASASSSDTARIAFPYTVRNTNIFYAHWVSAGTSVTVTFDSQGGSSVSAETAAAGNTVAGPASDPSYTGYTFSGWFTDSACSSGCQVSFPLTVTADMTLYAKWTAVSDTVSVSGISLSSTALSLTAGSAKTLTVSVTPDNASNKSVIWSSSDETTASVSGGTVTGIKAGTAVISATAADTSSGTLTASCTVTVEAAAVSVTGITLSESSVTITGNGNTHTLTASVTPASASDTTVLWTSGNTAVATVSDGIITSVSEGTAVITATTKDGNYTASCTVTVGAEETITDKIILHAYSYCNVYVWNTTDSTINKNHFAMTQEGSTSWYTKTIPVTSMSLIFTTAVGAWTNQTADLSLSAAGEYWYRNGTFTTYNPEDTTSPVLVSFTADKSGTVTGDVVFTISATDNAELSKTVLTLDSSTEITSVSMSGKSSSKTYTWDTSCVKNGTHTVTAVIYDGSSLTSSSETLTFTTSNANRSPVAVISGTKTASPGASKTYSGESSYDPNGSIASYKWTASGATISGSATGPTVSIVFPSIAGTATVSLSVTDDEGAVSDTVSQTVTVTDRTEDFREETIYFVITTRFYDGYSGNNRYCWDGPAANKTNNDPEWRGDFEGLIDKLDYIKALGFSAIWITPPVENASGYDYHGYHALNFSKIDDRYATGTYTALQSYQRLIDACHAKGIKIIQDIVLNHTGNWGEENLFPMFAKGTDDGTNCPAMVESGTNTSVLETAAQSLGGSYADLTAAKQYSARINAMKEDANDTSNIYHHCKTLSWNGVECQLGQIAGDCVDLNTENPVVDEYLINSYDKYIDMGVDAFRIDTVKHISRLMFNTYFNNAFKERGGDGFYTFGEVCARYRGEWNEGVPALSPSFYTWKDTATYATGTLASNSASVLTNFSDYAGSFSAPISSSSANYLLINNTYRTPDYTYRSGLDVIDFPMHWAFNSVTDAFSTATSYDKDYCDPTWNVVYVDSHDYAPDCAPENERFAGFWPDKLDLMFTFRGIPCIFYGSEIEFQKGKVIDAGTTAALADTGRAYYGANLEGTVTATDYGTYTASGTVASTLGKPIAQHIIRLNKIRRLVPALQKGQYSTEGCSGTVAFKRRYTDSGTDSFALVAINGQATFSDLPSGTYIEVITGNKVTVGSGGSITTDSISAGNMRVYVLSGTAGCEVTGKIGTDGTYLY